jgi:lipopolysaccharide biosynthesis regulator YciM
MDIWLFLLILSAILIGWLLGRWQPFNKNNVQHPDLFTEKYARGLNYLLDDDSDNAIKIFTDLVEVNQETIGIHIALGNLFRSKGEVDRAIKIHQNLLARPNLTRKERHLAIAELANDYLKAGLLDRAEKLYREMIELNADRQLAYRRLLDLYITEKSWEEAAECARILYKTGEPEANLIYSQCLCEIAGDAVERGNNRLARSSLDKAIEVDAGCVRAALILIRLHLKTDNTASAKSIFQRLIQHSPEYMPLYIKPARQIYNDDRAYREFLQNQHQQHPSTALAIALLEHYVRIGDIEQARQFLSDTLNKSPSFEAFEFALRFLKSDPDQLGETWENLSVFLKALREKKTEYVCSRCGYESNAIQWLCPSCRNWASIKPIKI